jgi:hypothetical protein
LLDGAKKLFFEISRREILIFYFQLG